MATALASVYFEPATLSIPELKFIKAHLGETPTLAMADGLPHGVNPVEVERHLSVFHQLEELAAHKNRLWEGLDAIADSIQRYLDWHERTAEIKANGGPRHPSMFTWDSQGNIFRGGIGSDSSEMVRHEINDDGELVPFRVPLGATSKTAKDAASLMPWVNIKAKSKRTLDTLDNNATDGVITCSICRFSRSYKVEGGRGAYNRCRGHLAHHLKTAKNEVARHRALYNREFK